MFRPIIQSKPMIILGSPLREGSVFINRTIKVGRLTDGKAQFKSQRTKEKSGVISDLRVHIF